MHALLVPGLLHSLSRGSLDHSLTIALPAGLEGITPMAEGRAAPRWCDVLGLQRAVYAPQKIERWLPKLVEIEGRSDPD
jgi:hypothetical protein